MRRRAASVADDTGARSAAWRAWCEGRRVAEWCERSRVRGPVSFRRHRRVPGAAGCAAQR